MTARTPDLLDALSGHLGVEAPDGMVLGWRSTRPDLRSRDGFRWPWPGQWAEAPDDGRDLDPATAPNQPCPSERLGGLCLARTWQGASSGGIPAHVALVVAYRPADVLGQDADKLRVRRCLVLDVVDVCAHGRGSRLSWANLTGAYLSRANLTGADLYRADLAGANLTGADLSWADLSWANLSEANLYRADLAGANLTGADLSWANLSWANLSEANLSKADLSEANLSRANLSWARATAAPPGWRLVAGRLERAA